MDTAAGALKAALRVLSAVGDSQEPDSHDVETLRRYAPEFYAAPVDEVACEVIQQALRVRAKMRVVGNVGR